MQKDFEHEVSDAYREKQDMQIEKMGKLIADMDNENHNLRKEFEQYKEVSFLFKYLRKWRIKRQLRMLEPCYKI